MVVVRVLGTGHSFTTVTVNRTGNPSRVNSATSCGVNSNSHVPPPSVSASIAIKTSRNGSAGHPVFHRESGCPRLLRPRLLRPALLWVSCVVLTRLWVSCVVPDHRIAIALLGVHQPGVRVHFVASVEAQDTQFSTAGRKRRTPSFPPREWVSEIAIRDC